MFPKSLCVVFIGCLIIKTLALPIEGNSNNGTPGASSDFTFHVVLHTLTAFPNLIMQDCAGVLLSNQWILSSANCVDRPYKKIAVVGGQQSSQQGVKYNVQEIRLHPEYKGKSNNFEHDIALLRTERSIVFNERIQPISLSTSEVGENVRGLVGTWVNYNIHKIHLFFLILIYLFESILRIYLRGSWIISTSTLGQTRIVKMPNLSFSNRSYMKT